MGRDAKYPDAAGGVFDDREDVSVTVSRKFSQPPPIPGMNPL
jgi:hypothetical protein